MIEQRGATEAEVILAFVRAEAEASRFYRHYQLNSADRARLIDSPDLTDARDNETRKALLAYRGYPNTRLFAGLPPDIVWRRTKLEQGDYVRLKHGNYANWMALSGGSGYVLDGARNLDTCDDETLVQRIRAVAEAARRGKRFQELILLETDPGDLIVFEGTTRATAYAYLECEENLPVFVGTSNRMSEWGLLPP